MILASKGSGMIKVSGPRLVERLKRQSAVKSEPYGGGTLEWQAAVRIERLEAALMEITKAANTLGIGAGRIIQIACAALRDDAQPSGEPNP